MTSDDKGQQWRDLYDEVKARGAWHVRSASRYAMAYKRLGFWLNLGVPVTSAAVAYLSAIGVDGRGVIVTTIGLTILAVIQSLVRPTEKFHSLSTMLIALHDWELALESGVRDLEGAAPQQIRRLVLERNAELSRLAEAMSKTTLPGAG